MTRIQIPQIGLGTWKISNDVAPKVVETAIRSGYRAIDCACDYGNEREVGMGINAAINAGVCKREDLFVTSKLWNTYHSKNHVRAACERSLKDLNLEYLDLYLIHFPIPSQYVDFNERYPPGWGVEKGSMTVTPAKISIHETWAAMEELVSAGLVKQIGVANFNCALLRELLSSCKIKPFANQVELHPYLVQKRLQDFCAKNEINVTAFSSFGDYSYIPIGMKKEGVVSLMEVETIKKVAAKHGKTPAQILLRWATTQNLSIIPKSSNEHRLLENLASNEFCLSESEMTAISSLDCNIRFNNPAEFANTPIYD